MNSIARWGASLAFLFAIVLLATATRPTVADAAEPPQLISAIASNCTPTTARGNFTWLAATDATAYWVDLSIEGDAFAPGTFVGNGPINAKSTTLSWDGMQPNIPYFWRVNALTPSGWVVSQSGSFVPCGAPMLQSGSVRCEFDATATVQFRWSPAAVRNDVQWMDLSIYDNGFEPGTFISTGALSGNAYGLTWPGIQVNTPHFYRITSETAAGRLVTQTGRIYPCPAATVEPTLPPAIPGPETPGERWILVDLARQEATAMIGDSPLFTAYVTTGKEGWETPTGNFAIIYRVEDEKMTSESIGAEEYYVLEDVLYTQYFTTEGHALHLNYWRPDYYFGEIPSSHGCVGIRLEAAEFFWRFAGYGTRVTII